MHISGEGLLIMLLVALVAGWLAGQLVAGSGFGLIPDIAIGIVGALIGTWLLPLLGVHIGGGLKHRICRRDLVRLGPPKLLTSTETLMRFSKSAVLGRAFLPLALSLLAERVTSLALRAPRIRSGPPKSSISAASLKMRQSIR